MDTHIAEMNGCSHSKTIEAHLVAGCGDAVLHLLDAFQCAADCACSAWEFALEVDCLRRDGMRETDLRWLMLAGYIEHAYETTRHARGPRSFQRLDSLNFGTRSCFVLTSQGALFLRNVLAQACPQNLRPATRLRKSSLTASARAVKPTPLWDRDQRELRWGQLVVKKFKVAAPNQETILAAFQEENWPIRVDDPLTPQAEMDAKRRLHDTIVALNRNRRNKLIRFAGDGSGEGIRWEPEPTAVDDGLWLATAAGTA